MRQRVLADADRPHDEQVVAVVLHLGAELDRGEGAILPDDPARRRHVLGALELRQQWRGVPAQGIRR